MFTLFLIFFFLQKRMPKTSFVALGVVARNSRHRKLVQRTINAFVNKSPLDYDSHAPPRALCPSISSSSSPRLSFHSCACLSAIQRIESPNVITVPASMRNTLEKIKEKEAADDKLRLYRRNKGEFQSYFCPNGISCISRQGLVSSTLFVDVVPPLFEISRWDNFCT